MNFLYNKYSSNVCVIEANNFPYKLKKNYYRIILPHNKIYIKTPGETTSCWGQELIIERADIYVHSYYRIFVGSTNVAYIYG